jgi:YVTN family beta-propeller protein
MRVIDTGTNALVANVDVGATGAVTALAVHPAGSFVYLTDSTANAVLVVSTSSDSVVATIPVGLVPQRIVLNAPGTRAYVLNWGGHSISVIDTATNTAISTIPLAGSMVPVGLTLNPAGTYLYVTQRGLGPATFSVIDTVTNEVIASRSYAQASFTPESVATTSDGSRVYLLTGSEVSVLSAAGRSLASIPVGAGPQSIVIGTAPAPPMGSDVRSVPATSWPAVSLLGLLLAAAGAVRLRAKRARR